MTNQNHGKLFIFSAPSGAGKTSLARAIMDGDDNVVMSISHTTRGKRAGELNGRDYHFVSQSEFLEMVDDSLFLEYAEVYGNYYGTSKQSVEQLLNQGKNVLLDIDWQGARLVRAILPAAVSISIVPPFIEELEDRLRSRGLDSEEVIKSRMELAIDEINHCNEADFIVLNDDFKQALADLILILDGQGDRIRPLTIDLEQLCSA